MRAISDFRARRLTEPPNTDAPRVELSYGGRDTGSIVPGALLERQYVLIDGRFLLFLTDDVPYEETLRIHLLSREFQILDGLEFGGAYVTAGLSDVTTEKADTVTFSFVHKACCRLRVDAKPSWRSPLLLTPGVRRIGPR